MDEAKTTMQADGEVTWSRGNTLRAMLAVALGWYCLFGPLPTSGCRASDAVRSLDPGWTRSGTLVSTPMRRSEKLPLSAQESVGAWQPLDELSDEFSGGSPDISRWALRHPSWPGRPPFAFASENVSIREGHLVLKAAGPPASSKRTESPPGFTHTAAYVQSKRKLSYGYVEVRARIACSTLTSAFFLMDTTPEYSTEIDVFEVSGAGVRGNRLGMSRHVLKAPGVTVVDRNHPRASAFWNASTPLCEDFHVYGLEWSEEEIVWYVDGLPVHRARNELHRYPLTVRLDLEAQSAYREDPREDLLPAEFIIDYVRAWRRERANSK